MQLKMEVYLELLVLGIRDLLTYFVASCSFRMDFLYFTIVSLHSLIAVDDIGPSLLASMFCCMYSSDELMITMFFRWFEIIMRMS